MKSTFLILLLTTACGSNAMTDAEKEGAMNESESASIVPNLQGWQIMPNATESCFEVGPKTMSCTVEFTAGDKNCGDATFKMIVKSQGYQYVQTLDHVIIRQGEFHQLKFESNPEVFNIEDKLAEEMLHAVRCYGPNGEIVKL